MTNKIALTGFMCSGKTSVLDTIDLPFHYKIDLDREIESTSKLSISQIFENYGEDSFRELESKAIERIINQSFKFLVLALGGGTLSKVKSQELILNNFKLIYLKNSFSTLDQRLSSRSNFESRPLSKDALKLFSKRKSNYETADYIIECDQLSIKEINLKIIEIINE